MTITAPADTSNIRQDLFGTSFEWEVPNLSTTISVAGLGTTTTPDGSIFDRPSEQSFGIEGFANVEILRIYDPAFANYDLSTSLGSITDSGNIPVKPVSTTYQETFEITSLYNYNVNFQATLEPVPEPSTYAILGAGSVVLFGFRRISARVIKA